ncbi:hypothetical protein IQ265_23530 [Nodosilinea sp. LEGE 06152]|uniref:hypothetical protein n=1 Tax=Nodosilinea sp. LEGE 06152 TaxID=2777966 RepID=UPI00187E87A3|nr:hypothetical protein [Nodosilinea sp. LEGE 06152]MBE9159783.1 hypothetical protein [Nodosilinea sp. LEGE 06152]
MATQKSDQNSDQRQEIHQPLTPEEVSPEQKAAHKKMLEENENMVLNPGDIVDGEKTLQEKSQQVAVDAPDITGDHIVVPTYFVVDDPEEGQKALHHVKDAEEISDVIRQARVDESGERTWN